MRVHERGEEEPVGVIGEQHRAHFRLRDDCDAPREELGAREEELGAWGLLREGGGVAAIDVVSPVDGLGLC